MSDPQQQIIHRCFRHPPIFSPLPQNNAPQAPTSPIKFLPYPRALLQRFPARPSRALSPSPSYTPPRTRLVAATAIASSVSAPLPSATQTTKSATHNSPTARAATPRGGGRKPRAVAVLPVVVVVVGTIIRMRDFVAIVLHRILFSLFLPKSSGLKSLSILIQSSKTTTKKKKRTQNLRTQRKKRIKGTKKKKKLTYGLSRTTI